MPSISTRRRHERNRALVDTWLAPIGARVTVRRSNGETLHTITESDAWFRNGGAYIRVRGIPGNTRLARVTPGWGKR